MATEIAEKREKKTLPMSAHYLPTLFYTFENENRAPFDDIMMMIVRSRLPFFSETPYNYHDDRFLDAYLITHPPIWRIRMVIT